MGKTKHSLIWKYFAKDEIGRPIATCLKCRKCYRTSGNTSNLFDHLKRCHGSSKIKVKSRSVRISGGETSSSSTSMEDSDSSPKMKCKGKQPTLKKFMKIHNEYEPQEKKKKELDLYLVQMICIDLQPFNIVSDKGFRRLCEKIDPRYRLPSCTTIKRKILPELYNSLKMKLKHVLNDVKYIALTTDVWTCSYTTDSYLTVTCHFIDSDLRNFVLETKRVGGSHTAINLAEIIEGILKDWDLTEKVVCIVTDNASTMVAMCNILKMSHMGCFAHTLNLTVEDALQGTVNLKELIAKVKRIVTYFKKSSKATDALKNEQTNRSVPQLKLLQDVATRWNSTYYMLKRVAELGDSLIITQMKFSDAPELLVLEEKEVIKEVITILAPFEVATEQISGSYVTMSLIIPIITGIYHKLLDMQNNLKTFLGIDLHRQLLMATNKSLMPYESKLVPKVSTFLDPRFKKNGFKNPENALSAHAQVQKMAQASLILNQAESLQEPCKQQTATKSTNQPSTSEEPDKKQKKINLFDYLSQEKEALEKKSIPTSKAVTAVRQYTETEVVDLQKNPIKYWNSTEDKNVLKDLAFKYLCIPATSVPSERLFSKSGQLLSARRSTLKEKNVDMVLFLNVNYILIE